MGCHATKILGIVLAIAVLLISSNVPAQEPSPGDQGPGAKERISVGALDLADIIPLAAELTGRLATLENAIKRGLDISAVENKYDRIEMELEGPAGQLQRLRDSKDYKYSKLVALREAIKQEDESLEKINKPVNLAIRQIGAWREEWLADKKRWHEWQLSVPKEGVYDQIKPAFEKANDAIEKALNLVLPHLEAILKLQLKAGNIKTKINVLLVELDVLIEQERRGALLDASPPMFSPEYLYQFRSGLWYAAQKKLGEVQWPGNRFFARQGWIVFLQGFLSLVVIIVILRKRQVLNDSKRWRFLAARPLSAGFFLGVMTTMGLYAYEGAPGTWKLVNTLVGGITFARLSGVLIETSWKRHFLYGLMGVLILTMLMYVSGLPLPLLRLYLVLAALVALVFCWRWARENDSYKGSAFYTWSLRLVSLFFFIVIVIELWGKAALADHLFKSFIRSITIALSTVLFMHIFRGGLEWVLRDSPLGRAKVLHGDTDAIIRQLALFMGVAMWGLVLLPATLMIWGAYANLEAALKGLLALGFNLGGQRITVGLVIVSAGILYGSYLTSWLLQKMLMDEVLFKRQVERGIRLSIGRLTHYALTFVGFLLAISALGFDVTKLTIILSALGVGIGFGLQTVVNNFVSGIILLFERPVRVGDYVELGGQWCVIKRIGIRSTTVQTFDMADMVIPNADLVNNQVTNWTLSNRKSRLTIPVGVAYGSDVPLVMETLMACAKANTMVDKTMEPQVLFMGFGESSLDFILRVWVLDADHRLTVTSELHQEIDRRFREAKIEIAFPQRDLHLRSVDEAIILRPPETNV